MDAAITIDIATNKIKSLATSCAATKILVIPEPCEVTRY
jgi:hypothetical protein